MTARLIWNLAMAVRRLLLIVDPDKPAAVFAKAVLDEAEGLLNR